MLMKCSSDVFYELDVGLNVLKLAYLLQILHYVDLSLVKPTGSHNLKVTGFLCKIQNTSVIELAVILWKDTRQNEYHQ